MIHPSDEEALQTIDAAVFSGDPDVIRERLTYFIERWQRELNATADDDSEDGESVEDALHDLRRASRWPT